MCREFGVLNFSSSGANDLPSADRFGIGSRSFVFERFSLTPALSRWERGKHLSPVRKSNAGSGREACKFFGLFDGGSLSQRERERVRENGIDSVASYIICRSAAKTGLGIFS